MTNTNHCLWVIQYQEKAIKVEVASSPRTIALLTPFNQNLKKIEIRNMQNSWKLVFLCLQWLDKQLQQQIVTTTIIDY